MVRIEKTKTDDSQEIYIINGQLQKAWNFIFTNNILSDGELKW